MFHDRNMNVVKNEECGHVPCFWAAKLVIRPFKKCNFRIVLSQVILNLTNKFI